MEHRDVLIVGGGLTASICALTLANLDVKVTMLSYSKVRDSLVDTLNLEGILAVDADSDRDLLLKDMEKEGKGKHCPRAVDYLIEKGASSLTDFLIDQVKAGFSRYPDGRVVYQTGKGHSKQRIVVKTDCAGDDIRSKLNRLVEENKNIEVIDSCYPVELITLSDDSLRASDLYKRPTCLGLSVLNQATDQIESLLTKEIIVADGGVEELYHANYALSNSLGIGMALKAGARSLSLDKVEYHPLAIYFSGGYTEPLPVELFSLGAKVITADGSTLIDGEFSLSPNEISSLMIDEMLKLQTDYLWLDLRACESRKLKELFPRTLNILQSKGFNPAKESVPVVPTTVACLGGLVVDKVGQTSIARLRAIGSAALTGVHGESSLQGVKALESLVWAIATAEDVASKVRKFAYYFPEIKTRVNGDKSVDSRLVRKDIKTLQGAISNYLTAEIDDRCLARVGEVIRLLDGEVGSHCSNCELTPETLTLQGNLEIVKGVISDAKKREQQSRRYVGSV